MKKVMGWIAVGLIGVFPAGAAEEKLEGEMKAGVAVEKLVVCTGVQDREPQGEATSFDATVGKVYCWLLVAGAEAEVEIKLGWWHKGNMVFECPLTVRTARFRTWANKSISEGQTGEWTVKVTNSEGQVLKESTFTVGASSGLEGDHSHPIPKRSKG